MSTTISISGRFLLFSQNAITSRTVFPHSDQRAAELLRDPDLPGHGSEKYDFPLPQSAQGHSPQAPYRHLRIHRHGAGLRFGARISGRGQFRQSDDACGNCLRGRGAGLYRRGSNSQDQRRKIRRISKPRNTQRSHHSENSAQVLTCAEFCLFFRARGDAVVYRAGGGLLDDDGIGHIQRAAGFAHIRADRVGADCDHQRTEAHII